MEFKFERFSDVGESFAARVTIRQTGQFGFNAGAKNRFRIADYDYCVLYYDSSNRAVGIQLVSEECKDAIGIRKSDANTYIPSRNFCEKYAIDYSISQRFELKQDPNSGYLYFELDKELKGKKKQAAPA